jgi:hypothetical protein
LSHGVNREMMWKRILEEWRERQRLVFNEWLILSNEW